MSSATPAAAAPDTVLVVDFGAQYAQLIARRVREARVYSEIVPSSMPVAEMLAKNPAAIILSGGPSSVYEPGAPTLDRTLFEAGVPVFGMCYGFQLMAQTLGGTVDNSGAREYGRTDLSVSKPSSTLFEGTPAEQAVWMSHGDACSAAPEGFAVTGSTSVVPVAAFENDEKKLYGVQYHPEVMHSTHGQQVLEHFLYRGAGLRPDWTTGNVMRSRSRRSASRSATGAPSAVCPAAWTPPSPPPSSRRPSAPQLTCVYVDHGLMRKGETEQVEKDFVAATGVQLKVVDAQERFLKALAGVSDPEEKRKIIGREFIRVFEQAQLEIMQEDGPEVAFLVQGTLYPDVVESGGGTGTANIKSHHNVGGLPDDIEFELVEPLRQLFKDEVRMVGQELGLPDEIVQRQPFPGPGLGIRIVGEVTKERLDLLREADAIAREELTAAGLDRDIWQCPVVLLADVRSVGVQGDGRTYGHPIVLRPVSSEDAMTADWSRLPYDVLSKISTRITNEVKDVNRVVLDVTSKPPGTIEWGVTRATPRCA